MIHFKGQTLASLFTESMRELLKNESKDDIAKLPDTVKQQMYQISFIDKALQIIQFEEDDEPDTHLLLSSIDLYPSVVYENNDAWIVHYNDFTKKSIDITYSKSLKHVATSESKSEIDLRFLAGCDDDMIPFTHIYKSQITNQNIHEEHMTYKEEKSEIARLTCLVNFEDGKYNCKNSETRFASHRHIEDIVLLIWKNKKPSEITLGIDKTIMDLRRKI
jgi:hypothetical protein